MAIFERDSLLPLTGLRMQAEMIQDGVIVTMEYYATYQIVLFAMNLSVL